MVHPGDAAHGAEEVSPLGAKRGQHFLTAGEQFVAAAAAAVFAGFPLTADPTARFHAIKERVEGGKGKAEGAAGIAFDAAGNFIAVEGLALEDTEDGEFGGAAFKFVADHRVSSYM